MRLRDTTLPNAHISVLVKGEESSYTDKSLTLYLSIECNFGSSSAISVVDYMIQETTIDKIASTADQINSFYRTQRDAKLYFTQNGRTCSSPCSMFHFVVAAESNSKQAEWT